MIGDIFEARFLLSPKGSYTITHPVDWGADF